MTPRPSGFTKIPNGVLLDTHLSLQARSVWSALRQICWENREDKNANDVIGLPVSLPSVDVLAARIGISPGSLRDHIRELRVAGYLETRRPSRREPLNYILLAHSEYAAGCGTQCATGQHSPASASKQGEDEVQKMHSADAECADRGLDGSIPWERLGKPPTLVHVDGRALARDTLAEACGVDPSGPRSRNLDVALNGDGRNLTNHPGINRLVWLELARRYGSFDRVRELASEDPGRYHRALAQAIRIRAERYRLSMPHVSLTPSALASWWLDIDREVKRHTETAGVSQGDVTKIVERMTNQ